MPVIRAALSLFLLMTCLPAHAQENDRFEDVYGRAAFPRESTGDVFSDGYSTHERPWVPSDSRRGADLFPPPSAFPVPSRADVLPRAHPDGTHGFHTLFRARPLTAPPPDSPLFTHDDPAQSGR